MILKNNGFFYYKKSLLDGALVYMLIIKLDRISNTNCSIKISTDTYINYKQTDQSTQWKIRKDYALKQLNLINRPNAKKKLPKKSITN